MTEREPGVSRTQHYSAIVSRQFRGRSVDAASIVGLVAVGLVVLFYMLSQQATALPSWLPGLGQTFTHYEAEFSTAQSVTPGQGQAVDINGIQVGLVDSVEVEDGVAVVGLDIEPEYDELITEDAELLLRPKTGLNDMVVDITPGPSGRQLEPGSTIPLSHTQPNVNPDEFLATLDSDTTSYLQLLVAAGADGISGRSLKLSRALRRLAPFSKRIALLNSEVAGRRVALARVVHNFRLLAEELARSDADLRRFVDSSAEALGGFADSSASIEEALRELPSTLQVAQGALASSERFSTALRPTLLGLIPQAQAFPSALRATERLFRDTTAPIANQIRPFTRQIRPTVRHTAQLAPNFGSVVRRFGQGLGDLNYFFDQLSYDPPGDRRSHLFYLPWLNHNLNATYLAQDATGPLRRSIVLLSCNSATLADGATLTRPFLRTVQQGANIPNAVPDEACPEQ